MRSSVRAIQRAHAGVKEVRLRRIERLYEN
jgi:hypothetical protein